MSARDRFLEEVEKLIGQPVVWGGLDCSEAVALGILGASGGKVDQRKTHRAQTYHDDTRPLWPKERALPGDFAFYGTVPADPTKDPMRVVHVAIILKGGKVLSADGATSRVTDPKEAALNPLAKVAVHESVHFRHDFLGLHRNVIVDDFDKVTQ